MQVNDDLEVLPAAPLTLGLRRCLRCEVHGLGQHWKQPHPRTCAGTQAPLCTDARLEEMKLSWSGGRGGSRISCLEVRAGEKRPALLYWRK